MASFTELLQIVITADSKGAVAGLGAVGKEAGLTGTNVGLMSGTWNKFKTAIMSTPGLIAAGAAGVLLLGKVAWDAAAAFAAVATLGQAPRTFVRCSTVAGSGASGQVERALRLPEVKPSPACTRAQARA